MVHPDCELNACQTLIASNAVQVPTGYGIEPIGSKGPTQRTLIILNCVQVLPGYRVEIVGPKGMPTIP